MRSEHLERMQEASRKAREERKAKGLKATRNPLEKAKDNPTSWRLAINAKCYDCNYDPLAGGSWRQQIEACEQRDCPLYGFRPRIKRFV